MNFELVGLIILTIKFKTTILNARSVAKLLTVIILTEYLILQFNQANIRLFFVFKENSMQQQWGCRLPVGWLSRIPKPFLGLELLYLTVKTWTNKYNNFVRGWIRFTVLKFNKSVLEIILVRNVWAIRLTFAN